MNNPAIKAKLAQIALSYVPTLICRDLLTDQSFLEEFSFKDIAALSFGDFDVSFYRSDLFSAVRVALSNSEVIEIADLEGRIWQMKNTAIEGELSKLRLSRDDSNFILPDLSVLSLDVEIRLQSFKRMVDDVNLPAVSRNVWQNILEKRPFKDNEVDLFLGDIRDTPLEVAKSIRSGIENQKINLAKLVPPSRRYFERLIGVYDGSKNIREYASKTSLTFFNQLMDWKSGKGFLYSLLLVSHSSMSDVIDISKLSDEELIDTLKFIERNRDRISQLGAIEVGMRSVGLRPAIKPYLIRLINLIFNDKIDEPKSGFKLLSALFILVDGELSRIKLFESEPPFYRRLAALSQAALIQHQLVDSRIDVDDFCEWVIGNGGEQFYVQTLIDMRLEPRWCPEYAMAQQIKADFIGRLIDVGRKFDLDSISGEIANLILDKVKENNINDELVRSYLPGPLEGSVESVISIPPEIVMSIQAQLSQEDVTPASFIALVNSALLFRIDTDQVELAVNALRLGSHRLKNIKDKPQLLTILNGLSVVAAVSRSRLLADELRILVRRYRFEKQFPLSIEEAIRICLMSSASLAELEEWTDYIGDWFSEFAFGELQNNDGKILTSYLNYLLHVIPELWMSCGRAEAALQALNKAKV